MRQPEWILRCFAYQEAPAIWVAICLDFDLAAQAESLDAVRIKLDAMIDDYVEEALKGPDRAFADQLLNRRAPAGLWLRYYWLVLRKRLGQGATVFHPFLERVPLALAR
jgi:hypothetical protein